MAAVEHDGRRIFSRDAGPTQSIESTQHRIDTV
jgi:hypothetical protein